MKEAIAKDIERLADFADRSRGKVLDVSEWLTRLPGNLNRHFSTHTHFRLPLKRFGVAFSGAAITFDGDDQSTYQISCDALASISFGDETVTFVELFGSVAERHTVLKVLDGVHDKS